MNTSKSNYESRIQKKIKVLKNSNIDFSKNLSLSKNRNLHTTTKSQVRKTSQTSAGFSIDNKLKQEEKLNTPGASFKYKDNHQPIHDFVDDEMDISYNQRFDSPDDKSAEAHKVLSRIGTKNITQKEGESIVPPLSLKNINANKSNQNKTTGKLTRTTMQSTQIRDKLPLNNLISNVGKS